MIPLEGRPGLLRHPGQHPGRHRTTCRPVVTAGGRHLVTVQRRRRRSDRSRYPRFTREVRQPQCVGGTAYQVRGNRATELAPGLVAVRRLPVELQVVAGTAGEPHLESAQLPCAVAGVESAFRGVFGEAGAGTAQAGTGDCQAALRVGEQIDLPLVRQRGGNSRLVDVVDDPGSALVRREAGPRRGAQRNAHGPQEGTRLHMEPDHSAATGADRQALTPNSSRNEQLHRVGSGPYGRSIRIAKRTARATSALHPRRAIHCACRMRFARSTFSRFSSTSRV